MIRLQSKLSWLVIFNVPEHFLGGLFGVLFLAQFSVADARCLQVNVLDQVFAERGATLREKYQLHTFQELTPC